MLSSKTKIQKLKYSLLHTVISLCLLENMMLVKAQESRGKSEIFLTVCRVCCSSAGQNTSKVCDSQASQITLNNSKYVKSRLDPKMRIKSVYHTLFVSMYSL